MTAFYNEIDKDAAAWLRELIAEGHIAPGIVDERSIEDVRPDELTGFTQCHFFAGVGIWSLALRASGIPDDYSIWTGSCPCQPFSSAGKGDGFDDERHLWPAFHYLISQRRPTAILGEQVASKDAEPWIDLVHTDMEALGYAFGAVPFPSAGIGAPHIRDRLYWVAHADRSAGRQGRADVRGRSDRGDAKPRARPGSGGMPDGMADTNVGGLAREGLPAQRGVRFDQFDPVWSSQTFKHDGGFATGGRAGIEPTCAPGTGPTNGPWRDADWLLCRDGKWRPVEPGTFPLAHGAPARVGRLRAYGNAVNAEAARVFIEAVMECIPQC